MLDKKAGAFQSARRLAGALSREAWAKADLKRIAKRLEKAPDIAVHIDVDELLRELRRVGGTERGSGAVLLVDDDAVVRSLLRMVVRPYAREVRQVPNVAEARKVLETDRPSAMVIDISLPDGDGRDLLALMQADPSLQDVPRIILTGQDDALVRSECIALGALEVHIKPLDPVAMTEAISVLLGFEERTNLEITGDMLTGLLGPAEVDERAIELRERFIASGLTWSAVAVRVSGMRIAQVADVIRDVVGANTVACRDGKAVLVVYGHGMAQAQEMAQRLKRTLGSDGHVAVAEAANNSWEDAALVAKRMLMLAEGTGDVVAVPATNLDRTRTRILVVDDDPMVAPLVAKALGATYEVMPLKDGSKVLQTLDTARPVGVIMDVGLPGQSGLELARLIRANVRHAKIPLVLLSSYDKPRQIETGLMAGADDYVTKPFDPVTLRARLQHALERRRG